VKVFRRRMVILALSALSLIAISWWWLRPGTTPATPAAVAGPVPLLTVSLVKPVYQNWPELIQADGNLAAWQEAVISAETGSLRITKLLVDVGSVVKRGQLLAELASASAEADVRKQQAAVAQARANLDGAQSDVKRASMVAGGGALSAQKIEEYRTTEAADRASLESAEADLQSKRIVLAQTRILAVDDGIISSRSALLGNVVSAGTELFRIVRQSRIEWQAELTPQQLVRIHAGQVARVTLPGGKSVVGQVRLAAPTISTSSGRAIVYVSLPAGSGAQSGMFASGSIELGSQRALTVPESALVLRDGRTDLYVLNANQSTVARRTVITGRRRGGEVEIVSGLDTQSSIVQSGAAFLSDGAAVKVTPAGKNQGGAT
jgi:RND family efflux transporter MFP subunit